MQVVNALVPEPSKAMEFFAGADDGPFVMVDLLGGRLVCSGAVTGLLLGEVEDLWDAVGLVEYPSLDAFQGMIRSPEMRAIEHHRAAGLAGQLNIRTRQQR